MCLILLEILGPRRLLFEAPVTHLTNVCAIYPYECWTCRIVFFTSVVCVSHILLVDAGEPQQRTVLHSYLQEDQTPQLWISLYYVDGYHLQVLIFEILGQCHCFFRAADLPDPFTPVLDLNAKQKSFMMKTELGGEVPSACCLGGGVPSA